MPRLREFIVALLAISALALAPRADAQDDTLAEARCAALREVSISNLVVTQAAISREASVAGRLGAVDGLPPACRVSGRIRPVEGSDIGFEVWLPVEGWNERLQQVGNGGMAGSINSFMLARALKGGYVAAATDNGHVGEPTDASWALDAPERIVDFAHRAVHETAIAAKALILAFYGRAPRFSYFNGCSEGGREALMAAQRYPEDFDGVLAGAPALGWSRLMETFAWNARALHFAPDAYVPATMLAAVQAAARAQCDSVDGLADGIISDPMACAFDPAVLACRGAGEDAAMCLTPPQIDALRRVYAGPSGAPTYAPGVEAEGGANGWAGYLTGPARGVSLQLIFATGYFANFVEGRADYTLDQDLSPKGEARAAAMADLLDADDPDLDPFRRAGGKLIHYHGWGDASPPPTHSTAYADAVRAQMGARAADRAYRLFMAPDVLHCGMGPGPNSFGATFDPAPSADPERDLFSALVAWVERGRAPNRIVATKYVGDDPAQGVAFERPLCPWPKVAVHDGKGDVTRAASFACRAQKP